MNDENPNQIHQTEDTLTENNPSKVSERKLAANRNNAQKSTGPKTPEGKNRSKFNALKHGLTSRLAHQAGGALDEQLSALEESLRSKFKADDLMAQLKIDLLVAEFWRQRKALEQEEKFLAQGNPFGCVGMPLLQRYQSESRRNLMKVIESLEDHESAESETTDDELAIEANDPILNDAAPKNETPKAEGG